MQMQVSHFINSEDIHKGKETENQEQGQKKLRQWIQELDKKAKVKKNYKDIKWTFSSQ